MVTQNNTQNATQERTVTDMGTTKLYGYTVSAAKRMIKRIKKDRLKDVI